MNIKKYYFNHIYPLKCYLNENFNYAQILIPQMVRSFYIMINMHKIILLYLFIKIFKLFVNLLVQKYLSLLYITHMHNSIDRLNII